MKNTFRIELNIDGVSYNYDSTSILYINIPHQISSDVAQPRYEVISQSASIKLVDKNNVIYNILNESTNRKGYINVFLNDNSIAHLVLDNISYEPDGSTIEIQFKDDLYKMQNKFSKTYIFGENISLFQIINTIYQDTVKIIGNYTLEIDDFTTKLLNNIKIAYGYVEADTFWNVWNKICKCGLLKVFIYDNYFCIRRVL